MDHAVAAVTAKVLHPGNVQRLLQEVHDRFSFALGPTSAAQVDVLGLRLGGVEGLLQPGGFRPRRVRPKIPAVARAVRRDDDAVPPGGLARRQVVGLGETSNEQKRREELQKHAGLFHRVVPGRDGKFWQFVGPHSICGKCEATEGTEDTERRRRQGFRGQFLCALCAHGGEKCPLRGKELRPRLQTDALETACRVMSCRSTTRRRKTTPDRIRTCNPRFRRLLRVWRTINDSNELRQTPDAVVPVLVPSAQVATSNPAFPPDLARVVAAWIRLPDAIKAGIIALVQAAGGPDG